MSSLLIILAFFVGMFVGLTIERLYMWYMVETTGEYRPAGVVTSIRYVGHIERSEV